MIDQLDPILRSYHAVSMHSVQAVAEHARMIELATGRELSRLGGSDRDEYFIIGGILHRYVIDAGGAAVTTAFHCSGTVMTPHFSRTVEGRSMFTIQALVTSLVAAVPVKELDRLRYAHEDLRLFGSSVVEHELIESIRQGVAFRVCSARERLVAFRRQYPGLENKVPHSAIASYLGITPVSFSRLRKELARESR